MSKFKELEIPNVAADLSEEVIEEVKIVEVTGCEKLRLRKRPDVTAPVIKELDEGAKLKVEKFDHPDFYKVTDMDGAYGYVMKSYTK